MVLCRGGGSTLAIKSAAAFSLYDYNGDGVISLEEMERFLTSVLKVMYHAEPDTGEQMGSSA